MDLDIDEVYEKQNSIDVTYSPLLELAAMNIGNTASNHARWDGHTDDEDNKQPRIILDQVSQLYIVLSSST